MAPLHTSLYAGLLSLMFLWLSYRITVIRRSGGTSLGYGDDDRLLRAVRVHGNFAEYVPFALVLLGLAELSGAHWAGVHALGLSLLAGRLLHAYGLSVKAGVSFGRFWGTALTFAVLLFGGLYVAGLGVMRLVSG